ncbi:hypothetical protein PoB_005490100 [Plakobranchus ocellatus]|uniref:Uncharacterized protein n=1 Tax=Plakobranchus ocellatus TaxID=259542 RepID=A0AAV4CAP0_9GAST|nr:hypothetical protein PoB_005490100 [Plakobranchus ocellatus]
MTPDPRPLTAVVVLARAFKMRLLRAGNALTTLVTAIPISRAIIRNTDKPGRPLVEHAGQEKKCIVGHLETGISRGQNYVGGKECERETREEKKEREKERELEVSPKSFAIYHKIKRLLGQWIPEIQPGTTGVKEMRGDQTLAVFHLPLIHVI